MHDQLEEIDIYGNKDDKSSNIIGFRYWIIKKIEKFLLYPFEDF